MLNRYTLPEMQQLWTSENKFNYWLMVELAVLQTRVELGDLSQDIFAAIKDNAKVNADRINELDKTFEHDMIAFIVQIQESLEAAGVGQYKEEFHKGLTSFDVEDTALILMLREAIKLIDKEVNNLANTLLKKAKDHMRTLMIARTHGQFAEPDTFGRLLLVFVDSIKRSRMRIGMLDSKYALMRELVEAKISGAVGNYAGMDTRLEKVALKKLGLIPAITETQILQRDRHAMVCAMLAVAAGSIEQMCRTFWGMMRSEICELREPRKKTQRGSSAMAHKRNPILTERLIGMARMVRACSSASMENIATPDCRDISQSNVEREIFPTATSLVHYMARKAAMLVENLEVFPPKMLKNLKNSLGVWASQRVRLALMEKGVSYDDAYKFTQSVSFRATDEKRQFISLLMELPLSETDQRTAEDIIGQTALNECFDEMAYIQDGVNFTFSKF